MQDYFYNHNHVMVWNPSKIEKFITDAQIIQCYGRRYFAYTDTTVSVLWCFITTRQDIYRVGSGLKLPFLNLYYSFDIINNNYNYVNKYNKSKDIIQCVKCQRENLNNGKNWIMFKNEENMCNVCLKEIKKTYNLYRPQLIECKNKDLKICVQNSIDVIDDHKLHTTKYVDIFTEEIFNCDFSLINSDSRTNFTHSKRSSSPIPKLNINHYVFCRRSYNIKLFHPKNINTIKVYQHCPVCNNKIIDSNNRCIKCLKTAYDIIMHQNTPKVLNFNHITALYNEDVKWFIIKLLIDLVI